MCQSVGEKLHQDSWTFHKGEVFRNQLIWNMPGHVYSVKEEIYMSYLSVEAEQSKDHFGFLREHYDT